MYTTQHQPEGAVHAPAGPGAFRPDIEGLRAVAILLVVLYHARVPGLDGGFVGVDVFFVLSGFLISRNLVRELETTGRLDLVQFFARRTRRLLPGFLLMLAVTGLLGLVVLSPLEQVRVSRTALSAAVYLSNVWFVRNAAEYFDAHSEINPLLHTWSLSVEEQFYLAWPLLLLLAFRVGRSRRSLGIAIAAVTVASFASAVWLTHVGSAWAFYGSPARAWEFGLGALAALVPAARRRGEAAWRVPLGWIGVIGVLAAAGAYSSNTRFPGVAALLPALGTVAVLLAGPGKVAPAFGVERALALPLLQRIGTLSYAWYLWHWPLLVLAAAVTPALSVSERLLVVLAALGVAALSHSLFEDPIRSSRFLVPRPALSLAAAALVSLGGLAASGAWHRAAQAMASTPEHQVFAQAAERRGAVYRRECMAPFSESEPRECVFGDPAATRTVVLFGDSHAAQWLPALRRLGTAHGYRLVTLVKSACPAADVEISNPRRGLTGEVCSQWREASLARIVALEPDLVVLGSSSGYVELPGRHGEWAQLSLREWEGGSRRTLAALTGAGIRAVVLRDTPWPGFDVPTCLSRAAHQPWTHDRPCTAPTQLALDSAVYGAERRAGAGLAGVGFLDLSDAFCDRATCSTVKDGVILYFDGDHLTPRAAGRLADVMEARVREVFAGEAEGQSRGWAATRTDGEVTGLGRADAARARRAARAAAERSAGSHPRHSH